MPTIELDIAYDCAPSHQDFTKDLAQKHGCTATLLKEIGPAGGNPLYLFTGTQEALESLIQEYDGDNGDADYLRTLIEN